MADWGPWVGDSVLGPTYHGFTPGAAAHTKGSWVAGSDTGRGEGLLVNVNILDYLTSIRTLLVDVGAGSPEQTIISNLMLCPPSVGGLNTCRTVAQTIYFPVALPPDALRLRAQASVASHGQIWIVTSRCKSGLPCVGSVVDTYGANTASTKGTTVTAPAVDGGMGSWTQISASCERIKALLIAIGHGQASDWTTFSNQLFRIQIGVGSAGNEQVILDANEAGASSSGTGTVGQMVLGPYYVDIPAGSSVSARIAKQYASSAQRTLDLVLYGIR